MNKTDPAVITCGPQELRPLKNDEQVMVGDFVKDGRGSFEPWMGPGGFRADSFVKRIYRLKLAPVEVDKP